VIPIELDANDESADRQTEALDGVNGTDPESADTAAARQRQWPGRLGRALVRMDVWILVVGSSAR
jgi:hypothetical protein